MHTEGRERQRDPAPSISAGVAALPQRARQLWSDMFTVCDTHLQRHIQTVLDAACDELFRLADQSFNSTEQQSLLESKREIQRARARVAPRVLSKIDQTRAPEANAIAAASTDSAEAFNALELVDPQQFEESVLLDDIAARLNSRSSMPLFELGYRVAVLQASPMLNADELPFGPRAITLAFREATAELDLPSRDRQLLFRMLEQQMGPVLRTMYEDINTRLVQQRILPDLQGAMPRRTDSASAPRTRPAPAAAAAADDADADADARDQPPSKPAAGAPSTAGPGASQLAPGEQEHASCTAAFSVLSDLLAKQREALGSQSSTSAPQVPETHVLDALKDLQVKTPTARMVDGRAMPRSMKDLRQELMAQLSEFGSAGAPPQLSPQQHDTIDLVSMLFEHLGHDLQTGGSTQSLLARLQVPVLRAAMVDHNFFSRHEHPARRLLNSLIETADQWLDQGEPDPALSKRLRALTHRVVNEYDGDNGVFDDVRRDIDEYVETIAHRAKMAEKRHVEAARGRERLEMARSRARQLIDERIAGGVAPELVNTMLEQAWTDVLSLTILRSGERSDAFRRRMRVTDQLLRFTAREASDAERTELRAEIASGLDQVGIHGDEATHLATRVAPDASAQTEPSDASADDDALTRRLRQRRAVTRTTQQPVSRSPGSKPLNKDEQAALDRLLQLPFGSILMVTKADGHRVRQKLAWYSPRTGRCLMLNQRGSRCDETSINALARNVANGRTRLPGDAPEPLLDRAWKGILDTLRQFAGQPDATTTTARGAG